MTTKFGELDHVLYVQRWKIRFCKILKWQKTKCVEMGVVIKSMLN